MINYIGADSTRKLPFPSLITFLLSGLTARLQSELNAFSRN